MSSIKHNYFYNLFYQIISLLAPLITTPYVSRVLGAAGIGEYSFAESIVTYFTIAAAMGTSTYALREISYSQNDKDRRTFTFWNVFTFRCILTCICLLFYYFLFCRVDSSKIYLILAVNILSVAFDVSWLFQGMENFKVIVIRNTIIKILCIAFIFTFVKTESDLLLYVAGYSFSLLLGNISLWPLIKKYVGFPSNKKIKPFKDFNVILSLFIPTVAISVYTVLDKTMIGLLTGDSFENGYYEQSLKISRMTLMVVTALGTVVVPRIGAYVENNEEERIKQLMYKSYRFVSFIGIPLCVGLIGISQNMIPWFLGPGFEKSIPLLCIQSLLILSIGYNNVTGIQYLIPTKRQHLFTKTVIWGCLANLLLNALLIPFFKSVGAAIASVFAESLIAGLQFYYVKKEISVKKIVIESRLYWYSALLMLTVLLLLNLILVPSFVNSIMMISVGAIIYFLVLILFKEQFTSDYLVGGIKRFLLNKKL